MATCKLEAVTPIQGAQAHVPHTLQMVWSALTGVYTYCQVDASAVDANVSLPGAGKRTWLAWPANYEVENHANLVQQRMG